MYIHNYFLFFFFTRGRFNERRVEKVRKSGQSWARGGEMGARTEKNKEQEGEERVRGVRATFIFINVYMAHGYIDI